MIGQGMKFRDSGDSETSHNRVTWQSNEPAGFFVDNCILKKPRLYTIKNCNTLAA